MRIGDYGLRNGQKFLTRERIESLEGPGPSDHWGQAPLEAGASVLFLGTVRNHSEGKEVLYLEYEAYEEMAEKMLESLISEAFRQWPVEQVRLLHRVGRVELGETAVAIEVQSVHRDEAYAASRFLIEGIKHEIPIWKREFFRDGTSEWSRCQHIKGPGPTAQGARPQEGFDAELLASH